MLPEIICLSLSLHMLLSRLLDLEPTRFTIKHYMGLPISLGLATQKSVIRRLALSFFFGSFGFFSSGAFSCTIGLESGTWNLFSRNLGGWACTKGVMDGNFADLCDSCCFTFFDSKALYMDGSLGWWHALAFNDPVDISTDMRLGSRAWSDGRQKSMEG